ncbi:sigma-70 family RNA polymerase sigma factor [bacterium]|nr:sigma-70 family RNA polymerase sigma factor [bacterium]
MTAREPDIPRETLERAARGDPAAFEAIVRRFERPVYALVHRLTGDAEAARDLAQDVFLKAWKNLARYDPERPFAPWFLKLAANLAINARAAARLRRAASLDAPRGGDDRAPDLPADAKAPPAAESVADEEARAAVRRGIAELEEKYALPVALFYLEGLSVKEVAERLDLPEGTVKIRLHRARDVLKEKLARFGAKPGS